MLTHVSSNALSQQIKLIVFQAGEISNINFYDRAEVVKNAENLVRRGVVQCVLCHGILQIHGSYSRQLKDEDGKRWDGWVAQVRCDDCKKYPALMPDFIMPYKRYKTDVIESVITDYESGANVDDISGCAAEASTMQAWINQFEERGAKAVGWLISILMELFNRPISMLIIHNKTLLKQLTRLLLEFSLPKTGSVIGRANIVLTTRNCGFL